VIDADPGFETIRTTLQSALPMPFVVTVTSSRIGDGKTDVAAGTARAFVAAGFSALVIDANPQSPRLADALGIAALAAPSALVPDPFPLAIATPGLPDALSVASFTLIDAATLGMVRAFVAGARTRYAVTIFDTSTLDDSAFPTACCSASDGVILAVRYGRRRHDDDYRLIATIEGAGGTIIGTVPTRFPARA
jgi:Mrp family chromosome partitioning ATPase